MNIYVMSQDNLSQMLEGYDDPAILVSADYQILATNSAYRRKFGKIILEDSPKCFAVSHGYDRPCDQAGEDCPLKAARESKRKEKVLHIHQTPNGKEHVDVEMIPIFDEKNTLKFFIELLKPVPLASGRPSDKQIVGRSKAFNEMLAKVTKVATTDASVLLLGESGTGKEIFAQSVHNSSRRSASPFIRLNCAAIPKDLLEAELFGYEGGAFTGAKSTGKPGKFELADKGSIFLDEIGELPLNAQIRLLRVLQNKEIERVGGTAPIPVDIRIIAATHRNLQEMVTNGLFREDLWYRLNVFPITIPPLRQRKSDIPALTRYFMERKAREMNLCEQPFLAAGSLEALQFYDWPGNVRELENMVERTIIRSLTGTTQKPLCFEPLVCEQTETPREPVTTEAPAGSLLLEEINREHIIKVLQMTTGKVQGEAGAAALLGVNPSTLRNKMKKLSIPFRRKEKTRETQ